MNKKIYILFALTAGLFISVHASENVNTTENRQFLKQQETLSQQLREKPDTQLQAWAEQQVRANPLQHSDNQFLDELVRKQQASQDGKPRQGALYFVSFSIPEEGLKRMLGETRHYGIPATLRGMVNNDLKATADAVLSLVKDGATDGVQIDPTLFSQYGIRSVPALVVFCSQGHDIIRGNLRVRQALEKVAATGDCRQVAQGLLDGTGDRGLTLSGTKTHVKGFWS
ncbi:MAG: type-F conjugative transfer system pilin assembly protein TrbC [Haemophilus parainfluenzae]|nr:type-F conjugative transfer system pilin assembly protein TrbC [Haemophilus parainfluenzae]